MHRCHRELGDLFRLEMQRHMRLLHPGCNHPRSDAFIFDIAFNQPFEILPDHFLVFADGSMPGEADRARFVSYTEGNARITAQIF